MQSLTFSDMSKAYGGVPALQGVTLTLEKHRIHALMGENGAGKSTLIKIIAGVIAADSVSVNKDGKQLPLSNAQDAYNAGFRFIHQELNVVPQISVAENILIGRNYPRRFGVAINWRSVHRIAQAALDFLGASHINVQTLVGSLPAGDKMLIKIAAALVADGALAEGGIAESGVDADLYVLDEPTAALTDAESEMLFKVLQRLKDKGAAILYVSHRLDEVVRISDDITILRDGKKVSSGEIASTNKEKIIKEMTGRGVADTYPSRMSDIGEKTVVNVSNVSTKNLSQLNFKLREGEILGVSGLAESGQTALLQLFMGMNPILTGSASFNGNDLPKNTSQAWANNVAYIPRERRSESLMLNMPVRSNIMLPHLGQYGLKSDKRGETEQTNLLAEKVKLKFDSPEQPVAQLSGGNQQKVVFARAICGNPRLLLLDEPTRGVDVGAKYDIYMLVRELSAQGCVVVLTSTDLPEVLGMCDRILVLHDGRQEHLLETTELSGAELLSYCYSEKTDSSVTQQANL